MEKKNLPALGIDLGGTKISAALVQDNKIVGQPVRVPTPKGPENIIEALLGLIEQFNKAHVFPGIGIATAGMVDPANGQVVGSSGNLPGWEGTPVKKILEEKTGQRVHVENDANAAAYGELCASDALPENGSLTMVTLGTGIGVGIVIEGNLYRGTHFASQGGHIKISMENRRRCTCELWDCWEAYGSGRGLLATGWEMLEGVSEQQSSLAGKRATLTNEDIIAAVKAGDVLAGNMLRRWHEHVACGLASLAHLLDPPVFVITGGMAKFADFNLLREMFVDRTLPRVAQNCQILPSSVHEAAGMIGAAALALQDCQAA